MDKEHCNQCADAGKSSPVPGYAAYGNGRRQNRCPRTFNGNNPEKIYLRSRIKVDNVDIEKMMLKLDYFGQDYVINKNLKGRLTGQMKGYMRVHPDLTPMLDQTKAELDVNIYNGTLINFTPMEAMSTYFKDKNLKMVRFDTLRNVLTFEG